MRREIYTNGFYHIITRSLENKTIFLESEDNQRFIEVIEYYKWKDISPKYSDFIKMNPNNRSLVYTKEKMVEITAYCLMPNHIHLLLKQLCNNGISRFVAKILDSYTRYFNLKNSRKGTLWEGKFRHVEITSQEQILHLTRYIHLNPVTAYLVNNPEDWPWSSYNSYISKPDGTEKLKYLNMDPIQYSGFVRNNIEHQRKLAEIKHRNELLEKKQLPLPRWE